MGLDQIPEFIRGHYEIHEWKHAHAILETEFPEEWADIQAVLGGFRLKRSWLETGGGRKSKISKHVGCGEFANRIS